MVDFYFSGKPHGRDIANVNKVCFAECRTAAGIRGKYITYVLSGPLTVTDEEIYKYLLFMRKIPEFKPWLKYPKRLTNKKEICFSCEEKSLGVFLGLTLFRAIEEFPGFVKEIAKLGDRKYPLSSLGIIRLYSNYSLIFNTNHWIVGNISNLDKKSLEKPLNNERIKASKPFSQGIDGKLFDFMDYSSTAEGLFSYSDVRKIHRAAYEKWQRDNL